MQGLADPLNALRDIHLPSGPPWWPPAPGWWLIALAILGLVCAGVYLGLRWWYKRTELRRSASKALATLQKRHLGGEQQIIVIRELAALLKRIALARYPDRAIAGLSGQAWLEFLDSTAQSHSFTSGPGRCLATAPYRPSETVDMQKLLDLSAQWVSRNT